MPADSIDHVHPRSIVGTLTETVYACRECNSAVGDRLFKDAIAKRRWLKRWIATRYRKHLRMPEWHDAEIGALGPNLQLAVLGALRNREIVRARLQWPARAAWGAFQASDDEFTLPTREAHRRRS